MHRRSSGFLVVMMACLLATAPAVARAQQKPTVADSDPVATPDDQAKAPASPASGAATTAPQAPGGDGVDVEGQNGHYTFHASAYEVRLNASVFDSNGQAVDSLPADAFHVYEDGVPQTVVGFRHEDLPVSLGLLIDSSGSMYNKRQAVDAASLDLVKLSNPQDEAFLVDFSSEAYLDQDFTSDVSKLESGLSYVKSSGGTAIYDAVVAAADHLSQSAKRSKQVLLIITDGDDNSSSATLEQAIRRVQDLDGPTIYCIGLLFGDDVTRNEVKHSKEVLTELAEQTGGQAFFPKSLKEVDGLTREVAQDIRTQYTLEYHSTKPPSLGGYRTIHVEAKEKGYRGLVVRTRSGYFPKTSGEAKPSGEAK